jgi:hypothetical protein
VKRPALNGGLRLHDQKVTHPADHEVIDLAPRVRAGICEQDVVEDAVILGLVKLAVDIPPCVLLGGLTGGFCCVAQSGHRTCLVVALGYDDATADDISGALFRGDWELLGFTIGIRFALSFDAPRLLPD